MACIQRCSLYLLTKDLNYCRLRIHLIQPYKQTHYKIDIICIS